MGLNCRVVNLIKSSASLVINEHAAPVSINAIRPLSGDPKGIPKRTSPLTGSQEVRESSSWPSSLTPAASLVAGAGPDAVVTVPGTVQGTADTAVVERSIVDKQLQLLES